MRKKILSVSIAAYNVDKFLENTVHSIVKEKSILDSVEIIIVNDGSTDTTLEIANNLKKAFPSSVIVIDKKNGGYGSTINASLEIANGKYYKLLDGDDWFNTKVLQEFISFLSTAEEDMIVSPYYEVINEYSLVDNHRDIPENGTNISKYVPTNFLFAMHELTIKTSSFKKLEKNIAEHCFYTDTEFVFYAFASATTMRYFDKPVYCYRLGVEGQSVSLSGTRKHYKDFIIVAERLCKSYEEVNLRECDEKKKIFDYILMKYMYNTFKAFMILEKPVKEKNTLKTFDNIIRTNYPKAYSATNGSNLVVILRKLRFRFYSIISIVVMSKHRREFI